MVAPGAHAQGPGRGMSKNEPTPISPDTHFPRPVGRPNANVPRRSEVRPLSLIYPVKRIIPAPAPSRHPGARLRPSRAGLRDRISPGRARLRPSRAGLRDRISPGRARLRPSGHRRSARPPGLSQRVRGRARLRPSRASRRPRYRNRETIEQRSQLLSFGRFDHVISIKPKRIIAGGMSQGFIPRRREVVDPDVFFRRC